MMENQRSTCDSPTLWDGATWIVSAKQAESLEDPSVNQSGLTLNQSDLSLNQSDLTLYQSDLSLSQIDPSVSHRHSSGK